MPLLDALQYLQNWADSRLVVPGAPAEVHLNLKAGLHLKRDIQATTSADEDYVEHSLFPLESLFLSVLKHNPKYKFQDMGLATDCANLTALYGFMRGTADKDFSVDVTRVGELILFQQVLPTENSVPNFSHAHLPGYQQDFVLRYALKERRHSKGQHHRVIQCKIGGLNVLVRSLNTAVLHKPVHERTHPGTLTRDMHKPEFTGTYTGVKPLRLRLLDTTEGLDTSFSDLRLGALLDTVDREHTQSVATRLVLNDSKESDADPQYDIEGTSGGEADEKVRHGDSTKKTNPASARLRDRGSSTRTQQYSGRNKTRAKDTCGNKRDARAHPRTGDRGSHARSTRDDVATRAQRVHSQHSGVYGSRGVSTATTLQYTSELDLDLGSTDHTAQVRRACSKDTTRGTTSGSTACSTAELPTRESTDTHTQAHYSQTRPTQLGAPSPIPQKLPTPIAKVCGESDALRALVTPLNRTTMEQPCDSPAIAATSSTGTATELTKRDRRPEGMTRTK
ncbi:hypothetical protein SARC_02755 [Sphaeroforma arctica JP610]|uniref:Uncharacterized protein n=1 Tax=Sphaeroforma arctica JP610 TaxID=667725 RepID=A0A0L0G7S8_9EUKA|nr:hypothetical protein SARC_02755 [Sphaeroforma arctica JP610]KNC85062.1 hypothetical protein SARC_02755 [Sphaeroforma arctica JP610]|eukprot:XP_014158964.1 hypothetical protein SARC_02755 [Sphaeroforma arctica JP610]